MINWASPEMKSLLTDPLKFKKLCWPDITFYDKQLEIIYSLRDNDETIVPAGNMLGKDFISGFCAIWYFLSRSPCRVITTSVDHTQLKSVLWGEIRRFMQTSKYELPVLDNDLLLRQVINDSVEPRSYLMGRVAKLGEGLLGHHIERGPNGEDRTLAIFDEASGIPDSNKEATETWAHKSLIIGNCYPCQNFFEKGSEGGKQLSNDGTRVYRNVIRIKGEDSPNVRLAQREIEMGLTPSHRQVIPGVLSYADYIKRRETWDKIRQCIGLDAQFYKGAEFMLCPPQWMDRAITIAKILGKVKRKGKAIGVDPAEGGDNTSWCVVDELGILYMQSQRTSDPSDISGITINLMREYDVAPEKVLFDRGGGGQQIAAFMRKMGHDVQTVGFGEQATDLAEFKRVKTKTDKKDRVEHRYIYKNKRAEMYGCIRDKIDPVYNEIGFGIPAEYEELHRQLRLIPLLYDPEGRLYLPPKDKKNKDAKEVTLKELIGHSPDEADSCALAIHSMVREFKVVTAGAF